MEKLRTLLRAVIQKVQSGLMFVLLLVLYLVGFGITYLFAALFSRRLLKPALPTERSFWANAEGYRPDKDDALRQT